MNQTDKAGIDFSAGNVGSIFRKIFFPTLLGMIFTALITIVDGIFVGQGVGPDGIAAVNIIAPLYMVATGAGLMMGIGASVKAGIALAEDKVNEANAIVSQSFAVSSLLMILLIIVVLCSPQQVARLMGSSDNLLPHAVDYLTWIVFATLFVAWNAIGMMVIRLDGSPKYAMLINVIPAILNIIGDYILIFPCGMGVKGAAIATSASVAVGGIMTVAYFRFSYVLKLTASLQKFARNLRQVVAIGSSAFIAEVAMAVMMMVGNFIFMRYFGDAGVAAYSIACYLFPLFFMISNAVAQSAQPIISYNYGARNIARVRSAFNISRLVAILCGAIVCLCIALTAKITVAMFIPVDSEAGLIATRGLPIFASCAIFVALNIAYIGYYQSIDRAARAMIYTLLRGIIILIPSFFLLSSLFPAWGMWAAIPASEVITLLIILATSTR